MREFRILGPLEVLLDGRPCRWAASASARCSPSCLFATVRSFPSDGHLRLVTDGRVVRVPRVRGAQGAEISADGALGIGRAGGGLVKLVDLHSGTTLTILSHGAQATAVAISAGGKLLATGGVDDVVRTWSANGRPVSELRGHVGQIAAIAFSPRGTLLATASTTADTVRSPSTWEDMLAS